ncbi:MAG: hypothetical protein DI629_16775 [Mesorhizobium amorphae]|nr:MAG: hypothetical protein DI629_16775 [Mesorhizobium amorphae]
MAGEEPIQLDPIVVSPPVTNPGFAADHGLPANTLFEAYPDGSGYVPYGPPGADSLDGTVFDRRLVGTGEGPANATLEQRLRDKPAAARQPPPTAPVPPPPEIVPEERAALAVCLSPDVCRSPQTPIPYMSWGQGSDEQNYSPDVFANGLRVKRADSQFSRCYGDEPGTGLGVVSNTVGDIVEPVTSSTIVRVNGEWVQRHTDRCTLNRGNTPGEYVHVKSTETNEAPDANDSQDKTREEEIADYARSKGYQRAPQGGWNTNPNGGIGWVSDTKLGEEMDYVASGAGQVRPFSLGSGPTELRAYNPSWAENTQHWVQERLEALGVERYNARGWGEKVRTLGEWAPVTGSGLSANESKRAFDSGQYLLSAIHAVGALPIPGAAKIAEKLGAKGAQRLAQEEAERLAAKAAEDRAAREAAEAASRRNAETTGLAGGRVTRRQRSIDELAPNGKVPGTANGEFQRWFDDLSPDELDALWANDDIRKQIERRIRAPGGLHEWFATSRAPTFKRWGVPMSEIQDLRTATSTTGGINPDWVHGGVGSTTAHNELLNIIDNSLNRDQFVRNLNNWADYRLTNGRADLPGGLQLGP